MILPRAFFYGDNDDCYSDANGNVVCNDSAWDRWIRWLVLGLIVAAALILFFLFSCLSARRRRRQGVTPYRGTGWTLHGPVTYNGNTAEPQFQTEQQTQQPYYNNSNNPPPAYSPPPNQNYYGNNAGIELQQPSAAYQGAYAPPKDPPPGKNNVIR